MHFTHISVALHTSRERCITRSHVAMLSPHTRANFEKPQNRDRRDVKQHRDDSLAGERQTHLPQATAYTLTHTRDTYTKLPTTLTGRSRKRNDK